ncbi:MAG: TIGR02757 family protein [Bacteroidales bacterium]|nr:TIGR02757 family protein [Bacteroidales bacterium]
MTESLKAKLTELADRYETEAFLAGDPSQFMHRYSTPHHQERAAFIAAALSYGSRQQFLPRIEHLLTVDRVLGDGSGVPDTDNCFYRLHTNSMLHRMLHTLDSAESQYGTLGGMMRQERITTCLDAIRFITSFFAAHGASDLIPKNATSACKRVCMFMRWMVRDNSPVDLGLWADQIDKSTLIMPMDTHVVQEARRLGLNNCRTASMASALRLTDTMREVFPDDPTRADFALFGLGVDGQQDKRQTDKRV